MSDCIGYNRNPVIKARDRGNTLISLAGLAVLIAWAITLCGCTIVRIPMSEGRTVTYFRCLQDTYIELTDPDTGKRILLFTSDINVKPIESAAKVAGALAIP